MTVGPMAEPVSEDRLLDGRVILRQPAAGYRAAIDPVLLAAASPAAAGDSVADLGCGAGAAFLCLAARVDAVHTVGLDASPQAVALARANIQLNGLSARAAVAAGDIADSPDWVVPSSFDQAICNPPFLERGRVTLSADPGRRQSDVEGSADLDAWIAAAHRLLRPKGWLTLIHRADRVDAVCARLAGRFGGVEIVPVWPKAGAAARRVIVRARKGVRSPARLGPGLVLHRDDGAFTAAATAILRAGAALDDALAVAGD